MSWNFYNEPADHVRVRQQRYDCFYFDNEDIIITFTGGGSAITSWKLRNYFGDIVASGDNPVSPLNLGRPGLGWYKLYFERSTDVDSRYRQAGGEYMFCVFRSDSPLRTTPIALGTRPNYADAWTADHPSHSYTGMAMYRTTVNIGSTFDSMWSGYQDNYNLTKSMQPNEPNRPDAGVIAFNDGNGTGGISPTATDVAQITQAVQGMTSAGCYWYEGRNEPNTAAWTPQDMVTEQRLFYENVKAANPNAKVYGLCSVSVAYGALNNYIRRCLNAGIGQYMDGMSFHVYNSTNGSLAQGRLTYDRFFGELAKHGWDKPLRMTEYGCFCLTYGTFNVRTQVQWLMLDMHLLEQYGVPRERYHVYYDKNVGFWGYPSYWLTDDGGYRRPTPLPAIWRVWVEETWGKTFAERLYFGNIDDNHFIGSRFTNPTTNVSVLAFQSSGRVGTIRLRVTGANELTLVDLMGNITTKAVEGGIIDVPVTMEPSYVRLPAGVSAAVVKRNYGVDMRLFEGSVIAGTTGNGPQRMLDGIHSENYNGWGSEPYMGDLSEPLPATVRRTFNRKVRFDTVVVECPVPWQRMSSLLDFDVRYVNNGQTTTIGTRKIETRSFPWTSFKGSGGCFTDVYWSRESKFVFELDKAVEADAVEIYVREVSCGGEATADGLNSSGVLDENGQAQVSGQGAEPSICIQELGVYLRSTRGSGATPGQPMVITRQDPEY